MLCYSWAITLNALPAMPKFNRSLADIFAIGKSITWDLGFKFLAVSV